MIDISADRDLRIAYKSPEKKPVSRVSRGHHGVLSFTKYIEKDEETKAFFFLLLVQSKDWNVGQWAIGQSTQRGFIFGRWCIRAKCTSLYIGRKETPYSVCWIKGQGVPHTHIFFVSKRVEKSARDLSFSSNRSDTSDRGNPLLSFVHKFKLILESTVTKGCGLCVCMDFRSLTGKILG